MKCETCGYDGEALQARVERLKRAASLGAPSKETRIAAAALRVVDLSLQRADLKRVIARHGCCSNEHPCHEVTEDRSAWCSPCRDNALRYSLLRAINKNLWYARKKLNRVVLREMEWR